MIIAIDESGAFGTGSTDRSFFTAVHIRQRKTLYRLKQRQFSGWEHSLSKALKNAKGEIKSSSLSDEQLTDFASQVVCAHYFIGITPFAICPSDNPESVVDKHRTVNLVGIREGTKEYAALGRSSMAKFYDEFGNWLAKLSYTQYLKIFVLGECMAAAMVNTVGHAITGKYDEELPRMRFVIDRDFIKEPRPNSFWHEFLRNQIYDASKKDPLPLLTKWKTKSHPFIEKYSRNGRLNFNELFWKQCVFASSHQHFEIRIADAVNTIIFRYFNRHRCQQAYFLVRQCFLRKGRITQLVLKDFDLHTWRYDPEDNPWRKLAAKTRKQTGKSKDQT